MLRKIIFTTLLVFPLSSAIAESDSCNATCESGEKLVSYTDGNQVSCMCTKISTMDPTVLNTALEDPSEYTDEGQLIESE